MQTPKLLNPVIMRGAADRRQILRSPVQNTECSYSDDPGFFIEASDDASNVSIKVSSPEMEFTVMMAADMYELFVFELWRVGRWIKQNEQAAGAE